MRGNESYSNSACPTTPVTVKLYKDFLSLSERRAYEDTSHRFSVRELSVSALSSAARVFDFPPSFQSNSICNETGA